MFELQYVPHYLKDLLDVEGFMAGYGKNIDWIQEYEHLLGEKLKTFTISDQYMIDMFEVSQSTQRYNLFVQLYSTILSNIEDIKIVRIFQAGKKFKSKEEVMSMIISHRNVTADVMNMHSVLTDMFPGIEDCIDRNLHVKDECKNKTCKKSICLRILIIK